MRRIGLHSGHEKPRCPPDGWATARLGDVADIRPGGLLGLTKERDYRGNGIPAYSAAGQDGYVEIAEYLNRKGVILSSIGANCGRCFHAVGQWTTLANTQVMLPYDQLDSLYLFFRRGGVISRTWAMSGLSFHRCCQLAPSATSSRSPFPRSCQGAAASRALVDDGIRLRRPAEDQRNLDDVLSSSSRSPAPLRPGSPSRPPGSPTSLWPSGSSRASRSSRKPALRH